MTQPDRSSSYQRFRWKITLIAAEGQEHVEERVADSSHRAIISVLRALDRAGYGRGNGWPLTIKAEIIERVS